jgi:tetratricopeptide (TPR) repeat protein
MKNTYQHRNKHNLPHFLDANVKHLQQKLSNDVYKPAAVNILELKLKYKLNWFLYCDYLSKEYQQVGKFLDAAVCYKTLLEARGANVDDLINLSVVLFKAGEMSESLTYARQAYCKDCQNPTTSKVFLECLITTNNPHEALELALEKLQKSPNDADYKVAVAQSRRLLGDWEGAIDILNDLVVHNSDLRFKLLLADAMGETDSGKALPIYEAALVSSGNSLPIKYTNGYNPKENCEIYDGKSFSPIFYYNLSLHYLRTRQFKEGWRLYEYGLDRDIGLFGRKVPYNLKGMYRADLVEKPNPLNLTIVCSEQGIGDQLICLSAMQEAREDFPNMILTCEARMSSIIKRSFPDLQLMTSGKIGDEALNVSGHTYGYMPMCSMLAKYRPSTDSFLANRKPFISVDGDLYHQYRSQLMQLANGRKILGISWQSQVVANIAKIKNTPFSDWLSVFDEDTLVVNLQYGDTDAEQGLVKANGFDMVSFNQLDFTKDLEHWLALSAACDGITCISTSLVHFAGACGQKVSVVMPYNQGHWSVGVTDTESIIYPNVNIFRLEPNEELHSLIKRASLHITKEPK